MSPLVAGAVRVPGSTSNLGSGFDCVGMAVDRWLTVTFEPGGDGLELRRKGTLASLTVSPEEDLLVDAFAGTLGTVPAGVLTARSDIPIGKGLGSSSAAGLAGIALARAVRGRPVDAEDAFQAVARREGHGDNAGPSAFGGLVAVVADGGFRVIPLALSPDVAFGFAAPATELHTTQARAALPGQVDHAVATRGLSRVVALTQGLATADPGLIRAGLADELHVPHRLPFIAGAAEAIEAAVAAGAWGATVSGAGSGILIVGPEDRIRGAVDAAAAVFSAGEAGRDGVLAWRLRPVATGLEEVDVVALGQP